MATELEAAMALDGFLSGKLDGYIPEIISAHADLFDFSTMVNRVGVRAWLDMDVPEAGTPINAPSTLANRIFARALTSFEASILLFRRGMLIEGGVLVRSVFEAAFWICFLVEEPIAAKDALHIDDLRSELSRMEAFRPYWMNVSGARDPAPDIDTSKKALGKRRRLSIGEVAKGGGVESLYIFYLDLCGRSAHTSMLLTNYYLEAADTGAAQHTIGPDVDNLDFF